MILQFDRFTDRQVSVMRHKDYIGVIENLSNEGYLFTVGMYVHSSISSVELREIADYIDNLETKEPVN